MSMAHRDALAAIAELLGQQSFRTSLVAAGDTIPYDVLVVAVGDPAGREWQLELSYLPDLEASLDGASILQCFAALPVEWVPAADSDLRRFTHLLNAKLPLGGFGALEDSRLVFYRHTLLVPGGVGPGLDELVTQATWMISYLLDLFGDRVMDVAAGRRTFEQALQGHPHGAVFGQ